MSWYINLKYKGMPLETVDETETMEDAMILLRDYQFSVYNGDGKSEYMVSSRSTKDWRDSHEKD